MKKIVACAALVGVAVSMSFAEAEAGKRKPLTEQQRAERRAMMRARREAKIAAEGGWVTKTPTGAVGRIVSAQKKVSSSFIKEIVDQFNTGLRMCVEVNEIAPENDVWATLEKAKAIPRTGLLTLVVEDDKLPRIVSAYEDGWSILNVKGLDADMPPKDVYENRLRKEINRAFAQSAGAGISLNRPCVMEPARSLTEIDALKFPVVSPEAMAKIQEVGQKRNVEMLVVTTYKSACQAGWAPAPTNDVQKKIWDDVHALPTNPMTIKYDPAKGK